MRARNTRRPSDEGDVRIGWGGKRKRVKQNGTDMIQLRRGGLQSMKVRGRRGRLTARMGFRHPHVLALSRHLLTAVLLGCRHRYIGHSTCHHRQSGKQYCQSENAHSVHRCQEVYSTYNLDATGREEFRITLGGSSFRTAPAPAAVCHYVSQTALTVKNMQIASSRTALSSPSVTTN